MDCFAKCCFMYWAYFKYLAYINCNWNTLHLFNFLYCNKKKKNRESFLDVIKQNSAFRHAHTNEKNNETLSKFNKVLIFFSILIP